MRLDVTDAFSSGGLCYEQGERCKVSTVKKWTPSTRNSGAQPYFSGLTLVRPRVKTKRPHALQPCPLHVIAICCPYDFDTAMQ